MSTNEVKKVSIGLRLSQERERIGFSSQRALAECLGISTKTQGTYERGVAAIDTNYLLELEKLGANIKFIVTGEVATDDIPDDAKLLLSKYLSMPMDARGMVLAMVSGYAPKSAKTHIEIRGSVGQMISDGTVNQPNAKIGFFSKKADKPKKPKK